MDGVFINLTNKNVHLGGISISSGNELVTPSMRTVSKIKKINGVYGNNKISIDVPNVSEYIKYPFTEYQIKKINSLSQGRTRLFILEKEDVEYWSIGRFQCPFRNYRLFTWKEFHDYDNLELIEYPIPKTYLDVLVDSVDNVVVASKKVYGKITNN